VQAAKNIFSDSFVINRNNLSSGLYFFQWVTEKGEINSGRFTIE